MKPRWLIYITLVLGVIGPIHLGSNAIHAETTGTINQELTGGTPSSKPSWAVAVYFVNKSRLCSASVISERYLLTAAHCVDDSEYDDISVVRAPSPGTQENIYRGRAQFIPHPEYERGAPLLDPEDDIALIRLTTGAINVSRTGRTKIYVDYQAPIWTEGIQEFTFAGWGLSDPGGNAVCAADTSGMLRIGAGAKLRQATSDQKEMGAPEGPTHTCPGDSGSAWLFERGGDFLAFAVTSGYRWELGAGNVGTAASIFPKLGWLYEASKESGCDHTKCFVTFLNCQHQGKLRGLPYEQCFSAQRTTGSPPDPGVACPQGEHCCDPGTSQCNRCILDNRQCN